MTTCMVNEQQHLEKHIEKQMGCMAGFLQIFDRSQILTGKRVYSPKRFAPSSIGDTTSELENSEPPSPAISKESTKVAKQGNAVPVTPPNLPLPLPIFELKHGSGKSSSSWKFCKETPRLSLDSRATTDANGGLHPKQIRTASILSPGNRCDSIASDVSDSSQQNRSPSVIARLMGLEPLQNSIVSEPEKTPELRRSASESRVSRDLFQFRLSTDGTSFYQNQLSQQYFNGIKESSQMNSDLRSQKNTNKADLPVKGMNFNSQVPWKAPQHRRNFFESGDIFPEPKQSVSIYGEIEKRLRMRGIDEQTKDLETLKQILEALQLKGLLHSRRQSAQTYRNFVYEESPIVMMKPFNRRIGNRRNMNGNSPAASPRPERNVRSPNRSGRSSSPTTRNEAGTRRVNPLVKHKPSTVETQRRVHDSVENRRVSPVQSPKPSPRRFNSDPTNNRSPRMKKTENFHQKEKVKIVVMAEDESSSVSGSSFTTSTDTERSKNEEFKEGKSLLDRCDKLLSSIAEMNSSELQPSPVSVLDSSFYKDESFTPSPVTTKRNIDFKDHSGGSEDEIWTPDMSPIRSKFEEISSDDCDFVYISEILRASRYLPDDSDVFLLLEKQQYLKGNDTSKSSRLQRKLIFDTISEILEKNRRLPPWKSNNLAKPSFDKIWSDFQKMRENDSSAHEDMSEAICGVLKKDLTGDGWEDCPTEMSEMVLDIERLVFKDLINESIRDLATLESRTTLPRRKLVF